MALDTAWAFLAEPDSTVSSRTSESSLAVTVSMRNRARLSPSRSSCSRTASPTASDFTRSCSVPTSSFWVSLGPGSSGFWIRVLTWTREVALYFGGADANTR